MNRSIINDALKGALIATLTVMLLGMTSFFVLEPVVGQSAEEIFEVTQLVSGAISFQASTSPVTMVGTLDGLTGGTSYGTTTSRVRTNNVTGYSMTISFASTTGMVRNGGGGYISSYLYSTGTANYPAGFDTSPANAQFGFTVNASNTAEVSDVFTGTAGTACGTGAGSTFTLNECWRGASTTDETATTEIINSSAVGPTPASGSTTTVQFRVTIPNNPSPAVPDGTYTATATLTATDN